jgi:hypothetical protein
MARAILKIGASFLRQAKKSSVREVEAGGGRLSNAQIGACLS